MGEKTARKLFDKLVSMLYYITSTSDPSTSVFEPGRAFGGRRPNLFMNGESHPISIDPRSGSPFYRQIIDRVLMAIASGDLKPGQQLPTVRQLAIDLHVNPNTVSRAYRELEIRQVVTTQRGTGTFVAADPGIAEDAAKRAELLETFCDDTVAEAGRLGFSLKEVVEALQDRFDDRR
jgi:GntR family transcriptional regulator